MTSDEAAEAGAVVARFAAAVLGAALPGTSSSGAALRRACGVLTATGAALVKSGGATAQMLSAATLARTSGATLLTMGRVRLAMIAEAPQALPAVAIVQAGIRIGLAQESRIIGATTFRSRQDIDSVASRMTAAFEDARLTAADDLDAASFRAITALHAAVTRHLAEAARPLPRMVPYEFEFGRPALALSYRLYGDAARAGELIAENRVVHPAFMPRAGRALGA